MLLTGLKSALYPRLAKAATIPTERRLLELDLMVVVWKAERTACGEALARRVVIWTPLGVS